MKFTRKIGLICTITMVLFQIPVFSNALTYDIATGTLTGFSLGVTDNPDNPSDYQNHQEVWNTSGFLGRLIYTGEPTQLTFSNGGPSTGGNRFYFTYIKSNGESDTSRYKEFFIVTRTKGLRHGSSGEQHDFSEANVVIDEEGETLTVPYGAGDETVQVGESGYNAQGESGEFDGSNGYQYLYPYRYIWIDLTIIRTSNYQKLKWSNTYESLLWIHSSEDASLLLTLSGSYGLAWGDRPPTYAFSIEKTVEDGFPFSWLQQTSTIYNALEIAKLVYHAEASAASIRFASDAGGNQAQFYFRNQYGDVFPFSLAFDASKPNQTVVPITENQEFHTDELNVVSPIDGNSSSQMHVLEGGVLDYLPIYQDPPTGLYTSTVYVFIEPEE